MKVKNSLTTVGLWFAEDPRRLRLVMFGLTLLAGAIALIAGTPHHNLLVGGPVPGGGDGSG